MSERYWSEDARTVQFQWMAPGSHIGDPPTVHLRCIYDPTKLPDRHQLLWQLEHALAQMLTALKEEIDQETPDAPNERRDT